MTSLASVLQFTVRRLHTVRPNEPVEMALHTAPNAAMRLREDEWKSLAEDYHWHIELAPILPGFQGIGGFRVNPIAPELAARQLRANATRSECR